MFCKVGLSLFAENQKKEELELFELFVYKIKFTIKIAAYGL